MGVCNDWQLTVELLHIKTMAIEIINQTKLDERATVRSAKQLSLFILSLYSKFYDYELV